MNSAEELAIERGTHPDFEPDGPSWKERALAHILKAEKAMWADTKADDIDETSVLLLKNSARLYRELRKELKAL